MREWKKPQSSVFQTHNELLNFHLPAFSLKKRKTASGKFCCLSYLEAGPPFLFSSLLSSLGSEHRAGTKKLQTLHLPRSLLQVPCLHLWDQTNIFAVVMQSFTEVPAGIKKILFKKVLIWFPEWSGSIETE